MIRIEMQMLHKPSVQSEPDLEKAMTYVQTLRDNGVVFEKVRYYDQEERVNAVRAGKYFTPPLVQENF